MAKERRIYKYPTGATIPEGAIYLNTVTQTQERQEGDTYISCWYVWHYFSVEVTPKIDE